MHLAHRFTLPAHLDVVWPVFSSLELLAPCFPGAVLTEMEGDDFAGTVKVKFGPVTLVYAGGGTVATRDAKTRTMMIKTQGVDERGNGTVTTTVTATLSAKLDQTDVAVETDLRVTGKPAQLGRGVINDVANRQVDHFVRCLADRFANGLGNPDHVAADHGATDRGEGAPRPIRSRPRDARDRDAAAGSRTISAVSGQTARTQQRSHLETITAVGGPLVKRFGTYVGVMAAVFVAVRVLHSGDEATNCEDPGHR